MHKSKLGGFIIDCETDDLEAAATFWSSALGAPTRPQANPADVAYVALGMQADEPYVEVQKVTHPSGVHLDIESDDVEREVSRLEALGARRLTTIRDWCVMEAPTGQRFCVVPVQCDDFDEKAREWP
jgi:hypothetical protein